MVAKNEQIIVRLSSDKKKKLQEIADSMEMDMSKLIRDKIDEIIDEYEVKDNIISLDINEIKELNNVVKELNKKTQNILKFYTKYTFNKNE